MKETILKKRSAWLSHSRGDRIFLAVVYGIVILVAFVCVYPVYFTVIASFSDAYEVYSGKTFLLPKGFNIMSYELVFQNKDIWIGYANTILYTVLGTLLNISLTIPAAYALSRPNMLGQGILMKIFLVTMYFGGGMIPTYLLYNSLGLLNTRTILVLVGGVSVYNVIVSRTFFQNNIPESLLEAARIDGANEFYIFARIVLPLSGAIVAVMTLYYAVGHWNSYFSAMIYTRDTDIQPLQLVLRRILLQNTTALSSAYEAGMSDEALAAQERKAYLALTMKFALVFISSAPMLIIYPFVQKYFVKGVMIGSIKG